MTRCAATLARCYVATDALAAEYSQLEEAVRRLDLRPKRAARGTPPTPSAAVASSSPRTSAHRRGARSDPCRIPGQFAGAGALDQPSRGGRPSGLDDRGADGLREAMVGTRSFRPLFQIPCARAHSWEGACQAYACDLVASLGSSSSQHLDPPYNQHRYDAELPHLEALAGLDACRSITASPASVSTCATVHGAR